MGNRVTRRHRDRRVVAILTRLMMHRIIIMRAGIGTVVGKAIRRIRVRVHVREAISL
jgi:hypothetical protein